MKKKIIKDEVKLFMAVTDAELIKLYFDIFPEHKMHILISYHYAKGQLYTLCDLKKKGNIKELYLDSGAFSANKGKSTITLYEYSLYLKLYAGRFDRVFNFDDEFDKPMHNMENQEYLRKQLPEVSIVPVLHDKGNLFMEVKTHVELGYDFVAIGSNHNIPTDVWDKIEKYSRDMKLKENRKIIIHIFGRMEYEELWRHRPHSADSSTYAQDAGRGTIKIWDNAKEEIIRIWTNERENSYMEPDKDNETADDFYHLNTKDKRVNHLIDSVLSKIKYERDDLVNDSVAKTIFNLYFYHELEQYLNSPKAIKRYKDARTI